MCAPKSAEVDPEAGRPYFSIISADFPLQKPNGLKTRVRCKTKKVCGKKLVIWKCAPNSAEVDPEPGRSHFLIISADFLLHRQNRLKTRTSVKTEMNGHEKLVMWKSAPNLAQFDPEPGRPHLAMISADFPRQRDFFQLFLGATQWGDPPQMDGMDGIHY